MIELLCDGYTTYVSGHQETHASNSKPVNLDRGLSL